jgi:hypothetical protein
MPRAQIERATSAWPIVTNKLSQMWTIHHRGFSNHCQLQICERLSKLRVEMRQQSEPSCGCESRFIYLFHFLPWSLFLAGSVSLLPNEEKNPCIIQFLWLGLESNERSLLKWWNLNSQYLQVRTIRHQAVSTLLPFGICWGLFWRLRRERRWILSKVGSTNSAWLWKKSKHCGQGPTVFAKARRKKKYLF